jgi:peptidoglycan/xylan/chitin deacetylase (PgdA/CDA1 family)
VLILAYHNIVPDGESTGGDKSIHLPQQQFARQMDLLMNTHCVMPLMQALSTVPESTDRPIAVITFDDAYRGAVNAGVAELRARNLPATIFVTPAYLGGRSFWWDVLTAPNADALAPPVRAEGLESLAGIEKDIMAWARRTGLLTYDVPTNARGADEMELQRALEHPGITLGSHTWSHPNLTRLSLTDLMKELSRSRRWLEQFGARAIPAISYPYGCADEQVWQVAQTEGYDIGLMIDGGWVSAEPADRYAIPRLNIPSGVSSDGFLLRVSGLISR